MMIAGARSVEVGIAMLKTWTKVVSLVVSADVYVSSRITQLDRMRLYQGIIPIPTAVCSVGSVDIIGTEYSG